MDREHTVKKSIEFNEIIKNSKYVKNDLYVIYYRDNNYSNYRFGISVSKKLGNAVNRNKYKRQTRSIINNYKNNYQNNVDYIIIIRNGFVDKKFKEKELGFISLINRINKKES